MTTPTRASALDQTETQFAVEVTYRDTDHVEIMPQYTRREAENRAAHSHDPWPTGRLAVAVERTTGLWHVHDTSDDLPHLDRGERFDWGVLYTWADGHSEVHREPSRAGAESTVRLKSNRDDPRVALVLRVLPVWHPIGRAS